MNLGLLLDKVEEERREDSCNETVEVKPLSKEAKARLMNRLGKVLVELKEIKKEFK